MDASVGNFPGWKQQGEYEMNRRILVSVLNSAIFAWGFSIVVFALTTMVALSAAKTLFAAGVSAAGMI